METLIIEQKIEQVESPKTEEFSKVENVTKIEDEPKQEEKIVEEKPVEEVKKEEEKKEEIITLDSQIKDESNKLPTLSEEIKGI